jgi:protein-S-isoprenylcysteine O-methyltransferase Ste14
VTCGDALARSSSPLNSADSVSRKAAPEEIAVFVLVRAITYAALFIGLVLVLLPARLLSGAGIASPEAIGAAQVAGAIVAVCGGLLALWCISSFALIGRGTPAPFDPPRRLVVGGPYARVRNPMYIGAILALGGASLFYQSLALLAYAAAFSVAAHVFVLFYEEPTLRQTFGDDYESYCRRVGRWWPRRSSGQDPGAAEPDGS